MRKLITVALLVVSGFAHAEWTFLGGDSSTKLFVDWDTQKTVRDYPRIWTLFDRASAKDGSMSDKALVEADCQEGRIRMLSNIFYSGSRGQGEVLYSSSRTSEWRYSSPGTFNAAIFEMLCGKKP